MARGNCFPRALHQIEIEMQVVQRDETQAENFFRLDQMP